MNTPLLADFTEELEPIHIPPEERLRIYFCRCGNPYASLPPKPSELSPRWCNNCLRGFYDWLKSGKEDI